MMIKKIKKTYNLLILGLLFIGCETSKPVTENKQLDYTFSNDDYIEKEYFDELLDKIESDSLSNKTNDYLLVNTIIKSNKQQDLSNGTYLLIDKEVIRNASMIKSKKAYLKFNQDAYLSEFLKVTKSNLQNNRTLANHIGEENFNQIFNIEQLDYLIEQTQFNNNIRYDKLKVDKNVLFQLQDEEEEDENENLVLLSRTYIFLSKPILTKNKKFGLIAFSNGVKGEMQGGISIYKKDADNWKFVTTISDWVE